MITLVLLSTLSHCARGRRRAQLPQPGGAAGGPRGQPAPRARRAGGGAVGRSGTRSGARTLSCRSLTSLSTSTWLLGSLVSARATSLLGSCGFKRCARVDARAGRGAGRAGAGRGAAAHPGGAQGGGAAGHAGGRDLPGGGAHISALGSGGQHGGEELLACRKVGGGWRLAVRGRARRSAFSAGAARRGSRSAVAHAGQAQRRVRQTPARVPSSLCGPPECCAAPLARARRTRTTWCCRWGRPSPYILETNTSC
jgi:hypothetical protein